MPGHRAATLFGMGLTASQKLLLVGLGVALIGGIAAAAGADEEESDDDDDDYSGHRSYDLSLPPGKGFELALLAAAADEHGEHRVLDNPLFFDDHGRGHKPDQLVLHRRHQRVKLVREAKDVAVLWEEHVEQAIRYDQVFEPTHGTVLAVREQTFIPDDVEEFAAMNGIEIERWGNDDEDE
jgi:hypothetical protein